MKKLLLILPILLSLTSVLQAGDDFQHWSQYSLKMIDTEKVDLTTFADLRLRDDASDNFLYYVSEKLSYAALENLSLGMNYTYLNSKSFNSTLGHDEFKFQHRLEFEANPHWTVGDWLKVHVRNRIENRWIEDKGAYNTRLRQRWTLTYPIDDNRYVSAIFANSELLYNWAENEVAENRSIPFGVKLKVDDKTSLNVYYMVQSKLSSDEWSTNHILGTTWSLKF